MPVGLVVEAAGLILLAAFLFFFLRLNLEDGAEALRTGHRALICAAIGIPLLLLGLWLRSTMISP